MDEQEPLFELPEQPNDKVRKYKLKDDTSISSRRLAKASREDQSDAMRQWFYENYEDPVHNCPHISSEGGYQYIYGGPYDAHEKLSEEFNGVVDDEVIEELADELNDECGDWSGKPENFSSEFDDYLFLLSAESIGQLDAFRASVTNIERLMEAQIEPADRQCMLRLLYVNVITALETYLKDKFISSVNADEKTLRRFVETTPEFRSERVPLSEVFNAHENIKQKVETYLVDVIWHRFDKVGPMFRDTLGIKFPDMRKLFEALIIRHDCVHRSGKTKDGKERVLDNNDIKNVLSEADKLVERIEAGHIMEPLSDAELPF